jgi:hypothetical protein
VNTMEKDIQIRVKLFGFGNKNRLAELKVHSNTKVKEIIINVTKILNIEIDYDEILILCNGSQLYPDDNIPSNCDELELFPLALGG